MSKSFKDFVVGSDARKAKIGMKELDEKSQKRSKKFFKEIDEDVDSIVEKDIDIDEETYRKYLAK